MSDADLSKYLSQFRRTLAECRQLYVSSGQFCARECPQHIAGSASDFIRLMDDLHRGLVMKVYFTIVEADRHWSREEREMAKVLFQHLWGQKLQGEQLKDAAKHGSRQSGNLQWYSLVRPFDRIAPLRNRVGELETLVIRMANLMARADGHLHPREALAIVSIQEELHRHLRPIPIDQPDQREEASQLGSEAIHSLRTEANSVRSATSSPAQQQIAPRAKKKTRVKTQVATEDASLAATKLDLDEALAELDALIGLQRVKQEVRTLTNFINLQTRRREAGLPQTEISLHMVFNGNPGTGKTTVARIVGKIFGAMGILTKGHLVETDRSGLVAEYAGQTATKTNARIDEALDGILFIDEAYSLVSAEGEDPFGREAIQTLLKRAEDDRHRLVVILAGYTGEMEALLASNPGLSSRFGRHLKFDDYQPVELARIFGLMCDNNRYELTPSARLTVLKGTHWWYDTRDRQFGNGRAVRNLFENSVRRLANRVAAINELTSELLCQLEAEDVEFLGLPDELRSVADKLQIRVTCGACQFAKDVPTKYLGRKVKCPECNRRIVVDWCELVFPEEQR